MKKHLCLALAALTFAACDKETDPVGPVEKGKMEQSYVAITLAADDLSTRADDGVYDAGRDEERAVNSVFVFFFKDGEPFAVSPTEEKPTENTVRNNFLQVELTGEGEATTNVSDVKDAVLVLENYQGEYPNQIAALLNWTPTRPSYTFDELREEVSALGDDTDGYVMSNAVYADKTGKTIDAIDLTVKNIGKSAEDAKANPITIYVERVAAKVMFTAKDNGKFAVEKEVDGKPVYAQITGFELFNDYEESWLIKRINPSWEDLGFNWNDPDWNRSYWATSLETPFVDNTFAWETNNTAINGYVYCGENTREWTIADDVRTKVIVKAQLVDVDGNPFEVVQWNGKEYVGEDDLKTVVANSLSSTYLFSTDGGNTFTGLLPEDIECATPSVDEAKAYEVYFKLSAAGQAKSWYSLEGGVYTSIADADAFNNILKTVNPALVYKNGMTYYYTDIKHLGAPSSIARYGVVRNHVYKVNISDITGYGTPVYNGNTGFITPEAPEDYVTYVSAEINVLTWRVVEHDYPLD